MNNNNLQPELVLSYTCKLGESPVWDVKQQLICWVDILKGELHQYSLENKTHTVIAVNQMLGAIGLCENGNFIAALQNGFGFIDRSNHQVTMIIDPEADLPGNRFNEGKCAPDGRFWAGTMALSEEANAGNVYCLQPGLSVIKKITGVTISNGIAWSIDHSIFYYIDTPTLEIAAYDYDKINGSISNRKAVIHIPDGEGYPDGMTIDDEGMLWIALWGGWKITRWNPQTGKKLLEIKLPVSKVSSCTFGGPRLQDLFITTAMKDLTSEELRQQPLAGSLFVVKDCGFTGLPAYFFKIID
ncbi:MAG TPA: SMP-30/gluconolactonase/LRE family protein [Chitinophagaceae bacterium]|jgi:sugar lactone lactonase YvrE|nr:SMP-30/gluconolactonase/LRE family protein [Chitinophagaceae bacterium]